jgi:NADH-quinone oxidoreductase subunit L
VATLAIAGIPPLAGFWSKDEILASSFERGGWFSVLFVVGVITALLTAFYMARQWVLVFLGEPRWDEGVEPHRAPSIMTVPLVILAVLSVVGGLVNTPFRTTLEHYLEPVFEGIQLQHPPEGIGLFLLLAGLSVAAGLFGAGAAYLTYRRPVDSWKRFEVGLEPLWGTWEEAYRVDDLYGRILVAPGRKLAEVSAFRVDLPVIDGAVNGVAGLFMNLGQRLRPLQTGYVRNYAALLLAGAVVVVAWLLVGGL